MYQYEIKYTLTSKYQKLDSIISYITIYKNNGPYQELVNNGTISLNGKEFIVYNDVSFSEFVDANADTGNIPMTMHNTSSRDNTLSLAFLIFFLQSLKLIFLQIVFLFTFFNI